MTPFALQYRLLKIFFTAHLALFPDFPFLFLGRLVLTLSLTKEQKKEREILKILPHFVDSNLIPLSHYSGER